MSIGNYVYSLVAKLAGISSGVNAGGTTKRVQYDINLGKESTTLYGDQNSEASTDALMRHLEMLNKGM